MSLEGKVWRYGDNIDTDVIIPARYLNSFDPKDLAAHCMEDSDEHQDAPFASNVVEGDIMVGGKNFGCGSSREHAPIAILASGISVVIAKSFARIFYRNAINIGLPAIVCKDLPDDVQTGDTMELHMSEGTVEANGKTYTCTKLPDYRQHILNQGC